MNDKEKDKREKICTTMILISSILVTISSVTAVNFMNNIIIQYFIYFLIFIMFYYVFLMFNWDEHSIGSMIFCFIALLASLFFSAIFSVLFKMTGTNEDLVIAALISLFIFFSLALLNKNHVKQFFNKEYIKQHIDGFRKYWNI